jgi:hypothetical protein
MTTQPSPGFAVAAVLGIAAALPGLAYVAFHIVELARHASDVLLLLGIGGIGPGLVLISAARMMRRPDRPVVLFIVALALSSVPTLLFMGLATFGSDGGWIILACLAGLLCAGTAAVIAIVAAILQRRAAASG